MRVLTEDEVRKRLQPTQVIAAIEAAFRDHYHSTVVPARSFMNLAAGTFLIMPCYDKARHCPWPQSGSPPYPTPMFRAT